MLLLKFLACWGTAKVIPVAVERDPRYYADYPLTPLSEVPIRDAYRPKPVETIQVPSLELLVQRYLETVSVLPSTSSHGDYSILCTQFKYHRLVIYSTESSSSLHECREIQELNRVIIKLSHSEGGVLISTHDTSYDHWSEAIIKMIEQPGALGNVDMLVLLDVISYILMTAIPCTQPNTAMTATILRTIQQCLVSPTGDAELYGLCICQCVVNIIHTLNQHRQVITSDPTVLELLDALIRQLFIDDLIASIADQNQYKTVLIQAVSVSMKLLDPKCLECFHAVSLLGRTPESFDDAAVASALQPLTCGHTLLRRLAVHESTPWAELSPLIERFATHSRSLLLTMMDRVVLDSIGFVPTSSLRSFEYTLVLPRLAEIMLDVYSLPTSMTSKSFVATCLSDSISKQNRVLDVYKSTMSTSRELQQSVMQESSVVSQPLLLKQPSVSASEVSPSLSLFSKGDKIDAECEVSNGSKRWFPGEVMHVHPDGLIDVKFSDGDVGMRRSPRRVRPSRRVAPLATSIIHIQRTVSKPSSPSGLLHTLGEDVSPNTNLEYGVSSRSVSSRGSEDSDSIFSIPSVLAPTDNRLHFTERERGSTPGVHERGNFLHTYRIISYLKPDIVVPRISLDGAALQASMNVSVSTHSLSSFLVSAENKPVLSTRLQNTDRSHQNTHRSRTVSRDVSFSKLLRSSQSNEIKSSLFSVDALSASVEQPAVEASTEHNPLSEIHFASIVNTRAMVAALLLKLVVEGYGTDDVLFTMRELFDECSVLDMDAALVIAGVWGPQYSALLKLLSPYFMTAAYSALCSSSTQIASGAFGAVYSGRVGDETLAIKRITREISRTDPCRLRDVFSELRCLQRLAGTGTGPLVVDCTADITDYLLIMEKGYMSLSDWRESLDTDIAPLDSLASLLYLYRMAIDTVVSVHSHGIIHFDIKCDNFMLRRPMTASTSNDGDVPILFIVDFGESVDTTQNNPALSVSRSRGTLAIQSPEMLALNSSVSTQERCDVTVYPSYSSDFWSCGCLLYELFLGAHMFDTISWSELYSTLCIDDTKAEESDLIQKSIEDLRAFIRGLHGSDAAVDGVSQICRGLLQPTPTHRVSLSSVSEILSTLTSQPMPNPIASGDRYASTRSLHFLRSCLKSVDAKAITLPRCLLRIRHNICLGIGLSLKPINGVIEATSTVAELHVCSLSSYAGWVGRKEFELWATTFGSSIKEIPITTSADAQAIPGNWSSDVLHLLGITAISDSSNTAVCQVEGALLKTVLDTVLRSQEFDKDYFSNLLWIIERIGR